VSARTTSARDALAALAELLVYPAGPLELAVARALATAPRDARKPLDRFAAFALRSGTACEEAYTATFDLEPACAPYVGHHLCGESPARGIFLARLAEVYAGSGFRTGGELPDHLAEVLRFLSQVEGRERDELLHDGALPAVDRMLAALDRENPYHDVLAAVAAALRAEVGSSGAAERKEARP
jgi:nitrate reductase delta subunit